MVNYKKIIEDLKTTDETNKLSLFAVVQMDELVNTWSVIFATEGMVNEKNAQEIYKIINRLIDKYSSAKDVSQISRIGIFGSDHYLVKGILKYGKKDLNDVKINGNTIHHGTMYFPEKE